MRACLGLAQKMLILSWCQFLSAQNKSKSRHLEKSKTNIAIKRDAGTCYKHFIYAKFGTALQISFNAAQ
jgi:hypothetical protein